MKLWLVIVLQIHLNHFSGNRARNRLRRTYEVIFSSFLETLLEIVLQYIWVKDQYLLWSRVTMSYKNIWTKVQFLFWKHGYNFLENAFQPSSLLTLESWLVIVLHWTRFNASSVDIFERSVSLHALVIVVLCIWSTYSGNVFTLFER